VESKPIRDALRAAAQSLEGSAAAGELLGDAEDLAAECVATFLRALPAVDVLMDRPYPRGPHSTRTLATAVEEAARHDPR